jgi:hypothetical protein
MIGSMNYLTSLFSRSLGADDPLLSAIYGGGQSAGVSRQNPIATLASAERNETQEVKKTAAQPAVRQAVKSFTQAVNGATSLKQLLANRSVMSVLLTANGMSDQIGYTALATQALMSKEDDPHALVNRLTDRRWKALAQTYDFAGKGLAAIQDPEVIASIANKYAEAIWQDSQDKVTPGLSNALAFKAKAASISSVDQILGDPTLRTVVTTALGVPLQIAFQPLEAQERSISSRIDITKFQDPKFVDTLLQRYLIANSTNSSSSSSTSGGSSPDLTTLSVQGRGFLV